jgi:hypothetical protein
MNTRINDAEESNLMTLSEQSLPTLWPPDTMGETRIRRALESCQKENRSLRALVVHLSEIVMRHIADKN